MTEALVRRQRDDDILDRLRDQKFQQLIRDTYCKGATDNEFALAMQTAQHLRLDPIARQIFFIKRWDGQLRREVLTTVVSIDGLRVLADRTGKYAGQTQAQWCGADGVWRDVWLKETPPLAARVGVIRHDFESPVYATARWNSYVQTTKKGDVNSRWSKMPDHMLAKCAEALALRKAFPADMSGVYTDDETGYTAESNEPVEPILAAENQPEQLPPVLLERDTWVEIAGMIGAVRTLEELKELSPKMKSMSKNFSDELKDRAKVLWLDTEARLKNGTELGYDPKTGVVDEPPLPDGPPADMASDPE